MIVSNATHTFNGFIMYERNSRGSLFVFIVHSSQFTYILLAAVFYYHALLFRRNLINHGNGKYRGGSPWIRRTGDADGPKQAHRPEE